MCPTIISSLVTRFPQNGFKVRKLFSIRFQTRRQVSKYFSEVFSLLVPRGRGKLHFEVADADRDTDDRLGFELKS